MKYYNNSAIYVEDVHEVNRVLMYLHNSLSVNQINENIFQRNNLELNKREAPDGITTFYLSFDQVLDLYYVFTEESGIQLEKPELILKCAEIAYALFSRALDNKYLAMFNRNSSNRLFVQINNKFYRERIIPRTLYATYENRKIESSISMNFDRFCEECIDIVDFNNVQRSVAIEINANAIEFRDLFTIENVKYSFYDVWVAAFFMQKLYRSCVRKAFHLGMKSGDLLSIGGFCFYYTWISLAQENPTLSVACRCYADHDPETDHFILESKELMKQYKKEYPKIDYKRNDNNKIKDIKNA